MLCYRNHDCKFQICDDVITITIGFLQFVMTCIYAKLCGNEPLFKQFTNHVEIKIILRMPPLYATQNCAMPPPLRYANFFALRHPHCDTPPSLCYATLSVLRHPLYATPPSLCYDTPKNYLLSKLRFNLLHQLLITKLCNSFSK
jgi:hypothetical protein